MDLDSANFLLSPEGRDALDSLSSTTISPANELKLISSLRKRFDMSRTSALIEAAQARQRATQQHKYSRASEMFFTRDALEQSSGEIIADYRAERYRDILSADAKVADLCCGIGGDTIALAKHFAVTGYDLDETRLTLAQANGAIYGLTHRLSTQCGDVSAFNGTAPSGGIDAVFFDPGRRDKNGKRIYDPERYSPPLSTIRQWLSKVRATAVKVSPGIDYDSLRQAGLDFEVEIISQGGEVKEAVLWIGAFKNPGITRRATLLPTAQDGRSIQTPTQSTGAQPVSERFTIDDSHGVPELPVVAPMAYIHEPDGAIIRAGLVELLGPSLCASKIDPEIAYLTGDSPCLDRTARSFAVLDTIPFSLKRLKTRLTELKCGRVVVKKRGSPLTPEELIKALAIKGDGQELTVILTRLSGEHSAIICQEVKPQSKRSI